MRGKRAKQLRRLAVQCANTECEYEEVHYAPGRGTPRRRRQSLDPKRNHTTVRWIWGSWKALCRSYKRHYRGGGVL